MNDCVICGCTCEKLGGFKHLSGVTSDSKPIKSRASLMICRCCGHVQKLQDNAFYQTVSEIYKTYEMFRLSNGVEQIIFSAGAPKSRSEILFNWLLDEIRLDAGSKILDYGCGDGSALLALSNRFCDAEFFGFEIEPLERPKLEEIEGFSELFIGEGLNTSCRFDLVTMIHSLEHIPNPKAALSDLHDHINDGGYLFIEVPNLLTSDYDILVEDHVSHFTKKTLCEVVESQGFMVQVCRENVINKELSLVAKKARQKPSKNVGASTHYDLVKTHTNDLISRHIETADKARDLVSKIDQLAIFGSSISAMWLWGEVQRKITLFVDEDKHKSGDYEEFRIISPEELPKGYTVLVPLISSIASDVIARLGSAEHKYIGI
jgi:2-polyprenyl-3-methyl-5-hydroxy-6-metoxy-1,4-benzoquinol methylase